MTGVEWIALVAGGGLGAGARYLVDGAVMRGRKDAFPLGIVVVNVTGCFLLGLLTGLGTVLAPVWVSILGVGVLGGYTTFSTVAVDSALLLSRHRRGWGWINLVGTAVLAVVAATLGIMIGGFFPG